MPLVHTFSAMSSSTAHTQNLPALHPNGAPQCTPCPTAVLHPNSHLGDLPAFMVAAQDGDPVHVAHFERHQQRNHTVPGPLQPTYPNCTHQCKPCPVAAPHTHSRVYDLPAFIVAAQDGDPIHVAHLVTTPPRQSPTMHCPLLLPTLHHPRPHSHLCDLPAFVVAAQDGDPVPVAHFECHQQRDCLYAVVASVHIVTHEQVVCVWAVAADPEQLQQIEKLSVNVATDSNRAPNWLHVAFLHQNLLGFFTQGLYCFLW